MFKREVQPLDKLLQKMLRAEGLETPLLQRRLIAAWDEVMPPLVVAYSGNRYIRNQTLFVEIKNSPLRFELSMRREELVQKLNNKVGSFIISDIRFL